MRWVIYAGMTLQMVLFSIFVGVRMKNAEKEKLLIQKELNLELTEKVRERTKSLQESNDIKKKLFSLVAHDLKSPLNHLSGLVQMMQVKKLNPEEVSDFTEKINVEISDSITVMDRLLQWSYKQLDEIHINKKEINPQIIAEEVYHELSSLILSKDINVKFEMNCDKIIFDSDMLRVVIRNLLSNAIKYSHKGGKIVLSCSESDSLTRMSIQDYGLGMDPEWFQKLVDSGKAMVKEGTMGEKGTGFGLLISKDFVEMNDGSLICESEEEKGTTFIVELPRSK